MKNLVTLASVTYIFLDESNVYDVDFRFVREQLIGNTSHKSERLKIKVIKQNKKSM